MSYDTTVISPRNGILIQQSTPADPVGATSATPKMAGLAVAYTPSRTGRLRVNLQGDGASDTLLDGGIVQIRYGTGTAPANQAALTGTAAGMDVDLISGTAAQIVGFELNALITGLAIGTTYWFDVSEAFITGGTFTLTDLLMIINEL